MLSLDQRAPFNSYVCRYEAPWCGGSSKSVASNASTPLFIYVWLFNPVVSFGAEAWTMTKKDEQALLVFERKIFRRIQGYS